MKLSWQISLLVLITISLSTLANTLLTRYQEKIHHRNAEKILAQTLVRSLRDVLVQDVIDGNKLRVTNLLKSLKSHDNPIEYLYVTNAKYKIFAHSFDNGFPRYLFYQHTRNPEKLGIHLTHKYQTAQGLINVYSEELISGLDTRLHIGINQSEILQKQAENTQYLLIASVVIGLFSLLLAFFWSRQITKPLTQLSDQIHHFGEEGKVDFSVLEQSSPEINQLVSALQNAMSERQQAIIELQKREQDLSITLDSIGDAVIATDAKGFITRMNPVAEKLTGWTYAEALGNSVKSIFPIFNASTLEPIDNPVEIVLSTGKTVYLSNHTTLIAKDGTKYQIADSAAPIRDRDEKIQGMVLTFYDVTEQYQLREAASRSRRNLQAIMDNSPAVIYAKDLDGKYIFINQQWEQLFHKLNKDIIGKTDYEIFTSEFAEQFSFNDKAVLRAGHALESEEIAPHDDGPHTYITVKFPLFSEAGDIYAVCGISTDITERKHQEEQLRRSQKMDALGKLTGGVAHDFNNMLGVVTGYAELLKTHLSGQEKLLKYAHEIHRAGLRGAKLTRKLLAFSRRENTQPATININSLLSDQQLLLEKTLTARFKLVQDLAQDLWLVRLDSGDLEDAIINMTINAMHSMETVAHGELVIQTRNRSINEMDAQALNIPIGEYVLLRMTDSGIGMEENILDKIFEPFFTTKGEKGTGLGLSQVYGFMQRNQGSIKINSELGKGSQFDLYFPRFDGKEETHKADLTDNNNLSGKETILVVDDEVALLELAGELLDQQGYKVHCAGSAKEALEVLKKEAVDLMFSDVIMPEMDGYQLAAIVQQKYPSLKIQLASGFSDKRHLDMIDDTLHQQLLHKPYDSETLFKRIRELLDSPRSE